VAEAHDPLTSYGHRLTVSTLPGLRDQTSRRRRPNLGSSPLSPLEATSRGALSLARQAER
jgi:hypothetical protein